MGSSSSTASWPGHICHHHHPWAWECGGFQQALFGLLSGDPDAQVRGKNQHFLFVGTVWPGSVGLHCRCHPCGGHHDFSSQTHPGSPLPQQCRRPSATFGLHFTSECHLDCLWSFRTAGWVIWLLFGLHNVQEPLLQIMCLSNITWHSRA